MIDGELHDWWPDLGIILEDLRRIDQSIVADLLIDAVRAGSSSSEILGGIGAVLHDNHALRSQLNKSAVSSWNAVMADVYRAFPGSRLTHLFARLTCCKGWRRTAGDP
jgi:hypothetical protein